MPAIAITFILKVIYLAIMVHNASIINKENANLIINLIIKLIIIKNLIVGNNRIIIIFFKRLMMLSNKYLKMVHKKKLINPDY